MKAKERMDVDIEIQCSSTDELPPRLNLVKATLPYYIYHPFPDIWPDSPLSLPCGFVLRRSNITDALMSFG